MLISDSSSSGMSLGAQGRSEELLGYVWEYSAHVCACRPM